MGSSEIPGRDFRLLQGRKRLRIRLVWCTRRDFNSKIIHFANRWMSHALLSVQQRARGGSRAPFGHFLTIYLSQGTPRPLKPVGVPWCLAGAALGCSAPPRLFVFSTKVPFGVSGRGFLSLVLILGVEEIQQRAPRLLPRPWDCCILYTVFF